MTDVDYHDMRTALGWPQTCTEEVTRQGELEPCDKTAVALRHDMNEGGIYPVCSHHSRGEMVPLEQIVRFLLEREEAQRLVARGLLRIAVTS